jgi:pyruvate/2-oxoglutarate dehydrogenase complex dihydrolipoamide acyltransferase (E2) component
VSDIVPRRRVLLASAAALPLLLGAAGCRSSDVFTGPDPLAGRPPLGHDVLTLQAVIAAEENMIDLYQLAISGDSGTIQARTLRSLLAQHQQHLVQLKARLIVPPSASASPSPSSASPSPRASTVSITRLRAAERTSAADLVRRLATAPPALAQLLASIAASDATHATALGG